MPELDSEEFIQLAADQLTGNVTSFLVDRLRDWETAFRYMDEEMQKTVIADASRASRDLVEQTVRLVAGEGRDTIMVRVKKVENDGDKIKVAIEATKECESRHQLFDAAGFAATLTVVDASKFEGGEEPAPDPDQPDLPNQEAA